jgi:hypothetical protein
MENVWVENEPDAGIAGGTIAIFLSIKSLSKKIDLGIACIV